MTPEWYGGSAGQDPPPHTLTLFHGWGIKVELVLASTDHIMHGPLLRVEQDGDRDGMPKSMQTR